jgi:tetratricopeptide (TPR) repeat protein
MHQDLRLIRAAGTGPEEGGRWRVRGQGCWWWMRVETAAVFPEKPMQSAEGLPGVWPGDTFGYHPVFPLSCRSPPMDLPSINNAQPLSERMAELEHTCFVIMPFGIKDVAGRKVDFDVIYNTLFEPAIRMVKTPEGKELLAARTDKDAFSASINQEMFEYIMYSRMAFADISGLNPNVLYEIGARHSAQEAGTVLFRQVGQEIPFDIRTIKVFDYRHEPETDLEASRTFITQVLAETLRRNRLDSPVRLALRAQWVAPQLQAAPPRPAAAEQPAAADQPAAAARGGAPEPLQKEQWMKQLVQQLMQEGEEATRLGDFESARINYWSALRFDPLNIIVRMRLGLILKRQGKHHEALGEFTMITRLSPSYGEAWRERGVAEGLIARMIPAEKRAKAPWLHDGHDSLVRATMLIPEDFDAWSSLGGVLKNVREDRVAAQSMYAKAARISNGHPYPLLNALKLEALTTGKLDLEGINEQLQQAEDLRRGQTLATPPADTPWCYFDLAEILLYRHQKQAFLATLQQAIAACDSAWQVETFAKSLTDTLVAKGIELDGLDQGLQLLEESLRNRTWTGS